MPQQVSDRLQERGRFRVLGGTAPDEVAEDQVIPCSRSCNVKPPLGLPHASLVRTGCRARQDVIAHVDSPDDRPLQSPGRIHVGQGQPLARDKRGAFFRGQEIVTDLSVDVIEKPGQFSLQVGLPWAPPGQDG